MANRTHVCKYCKKRSEEAKKFGLSYFCDSDCAMKYSIEKSRKDKVKNEQKEHSDRKRKFYDNDRSTRTKAAQQAFNAYIRERDSRLPCISCGRDHQGQYHAGHYRTTGAHPELRFEESNCHKQCSVCNNHKSGNIADYRINLIKKIGLDEVEWLEGHHKAKKYSCDDLKEIELHYKAKLKELKTS